MWMHIRLIVLDHRLIQAVLKRTDLAHEWVGLMRGTGSTALQLSEVCQSIVRNAGISLLDPDAAASLQEVPIQHSCPSSMMLAGREARGDDCIIWRLGTPLR